MGRKKVDPDARGSGWLMEDVLQALIDEGWTPRITAKKKGANNLIYSHTDPAPGYYQAIADGCHFGKAIFGKDGNWYAPAIGKNPPPAGRETFEGKDEKKYYKITPTLYKKI